MNLVLKSNDPESYFNGHYNKDHDQFYILEDLETGIIVLIDATPDCPQLHKLLNRLTKISYGTNVKTTKPNMSLEGEWTKEAWSKRKWGIQGIIVSHHDSHGLCYGVDHKDGTTGYYDPSEIEIVS